MTIKINSINEPTADESNLSQNLALIGAAAGDLNDNDVTVAVINGSSALPDTFENFLTSAGVLGNTTTVPLAVGLSGFDGSNSGADLVTITGAYNDLAFTDGKGAALDGDWSGLYTLDGTQIFLYTQSNNNIVLGRVGTAGGSAFDQKDTANASGAIAFAAYLDETNTGTGGSAKVWMTQFQPLHHLNANDPDDAVDMANNLYVSTTTNVTFDFAGLPSGQNEFLMFKGSSGNVGLIITGKDPDKLNDKGKLDGDTVNTSQGGGPTTIGTNNQAIDPPSKSKPGEGMIFTFVTSPDPAYTVPDLTHDEATNEANILYGDLFGTMGASINIPQQTPPKASTARLSAFTTAEEQGTDYYEGLLDADDDLVYISSVTIRDASGAKVAGFDGVTKDTTIGSLSVTFSAVEADDSNPDTVEGRTVEISGFESGYTLEYTTSTPHHRVMIEALDGEFGSSPFDIGGVSLPSSTTTTAEIGSFVNFEDDAPSIVGTATGVVDEEGLTGGNAAPEEVNGDVKGADLVASGVLTTVFKAGNDGLLGFGLDDTQLKDIKAYESEADAKALTNALTLTSEGGAVQFDVQGDTLWGFVDGDGNAAEYDGGVKDRGVFKLELSGTDKVDYKFTLLDNLDHLTLDGKTGDDTENDIVLALGSVLKVTDKDKDSVLGDAASLLITVDDDSPTADGKGQTGTVDEDALTGGNAAGLGDYEPTVASVSGSIADIFSAGADGLKSYGLSADTTGLASTLKSGGGAVVYAVSGDTLTAYVDGDGVKGFDGGAKDRAVYTLTLDNPTKDGSYTFKLLGPLDHPLTDDPSTDPTPVETSFEDDLILELGTILQITDKDGDKITAAGDKLKITVDDDSPLADGKGQTGTVDEDALTGGNAAGLGDYEPTVASVGGSIADIFSAGADGLKSYGLSADTTGLASTLKSSGGAVVYAVSGDTLTAYVDGDGVKGFDGGAKDRAVYTLTLDNPTKDGSYTFKLLGPLDHPLTDDPSTDPTPVETSFEDDLILELGTILQITDKDGDKITAAGDKLKITVDDDSPLADGKGQTGTVDEDALSGGNAAGLGDYEPTVASVSGSIADIFSAGADGLKSYGLSADTTGLASTLKSGGGAVVYAVKGDTLTAFVDGDGNAAEYDGGAKDRAVYTLTLDNPTKDGSYTFKLLGPLDHPGTDDPSTDPTPVETSFEDDLILELGTILQITDKDGDKITAAGDKLKITVDDDSPLADGKGQTGTVDEDALSGGNAAGLGDYEPTVASVSGSIADIFSAGADGLKSYGLSADTTGLASTLKSGGGAVVYAVKGDTLTAFVDGDGNAAEYDGGAKDRAVYTLTLDNPTKDGSYTFKLLGPLDHPLTDDPSTDPTPVETSFEDDLILELGTILQITDKDGDKITAAGDKLKITVDDDSPVGFTPDSIKLLNDGKSSGTKNLNSDTAAGADGLGTLVFVDTSSKDNYLYDAKANLLKSGGENIVLSGFGTGTLTAVRETGGETVFTAKIDTSATDQYTVTFSRTIDDGGGISFLGAAPVKSGNPTYNLIDNVSGTKLDLLFSGGDVDGGAPTSHSVNVSTQGAGTDNQSMNEGDLLRIDFMNGGALAGSPLGSDFNMGTQQTVNGYSFVLTQNTPSGTTGTVFVQAFDADSDKDFVGDGGDKLDPITKLTVNGVTLVDKGALVGSGSTTVNGHTVQAILYNGGVILTGLNEGQTGDAVGADDPVIKLYTKDGFNRIETSNYDGVVVNGQTLQGDDFDIAPAGVDVAVQGTQFNFDLAVQMTDFDGDTGPVELIGVTIDPVPV